MASVEVKLSNTEPDLKTLRAQECESRGGRPGLPLSLIILTVTVDTELEKRLTVTVDVKQQH